MFSIDWSRQKIKVEDKSCKYIVPWIYSLVSGVTKKKKNELGHDKTWEKLSESIIIADFLYVFLWLGSFVIFQKLKPSLKYNVNGLWEVKVEHEMQNRNV